MKTMQEYANWAVKLWIDNTEGDYNYWNNEAQEAWDATDEGDDADTRSQDARATLADRLKEQHTNDMPEIGNNVYSDLLSAALDYVDWFDMANDILEALEIDGYKAREV